MKFAPLYSFVEVIRNGANIKQAKTCTQGIPITRIETISNNKFNWDKLGYASIFDDKYKNFYLEDGDVLFSHINSKKFVGRSVLVKTNGKKIIHGMNLLKIRFKKDIFLPKFFIWYSQTQSFKTAINAIIKNAVNQSSVSIGDVKNIPVPSIDLHKQREIVENLNNIEQAIQVKQEQLKALDELIQSRFTEMFGRQTFEVKPIRVLVSDNIKTTKKVFTKDDEIEYIDISSIDNTQNTITGTTKYIVAQAPSRAQQYTQYNDILVSTVRPNLKNIAINKHTEPNLIASSGFCILRPERCAPEYLLYNVLSNEFTTKMISLTTGASYPAIRDNDVLNYTIPVPPLPLQNQFAEFVQQVERAKEIVKIQIKDLQELLALKMDEYFK